MKNILILNTGGTFSSQASENGLAPSITGDEILKKLGIVQEDINLTVEDYCSLDSANIMPEDWVSIARKIAGSLADYDGFIVIHGTDTLAYTSSMLSFMLQNIQVPVVVTGSQMPLNTPLSDALMNLQCAVWMATSGVPGVFVAFDRKIMLGCRTSKVRTISFNAFESINHPYVGEVNAFGLQLYTDRKPKMVRINLQTDYSEKIAVLKVFPGMNLEIFSFLQDRGYEGVYIEGFGLGGLPFLRNDITAEIKKASDNGLPILVGSQCRYEGSDLNVYETGQRILDCGGIPVYDMTQEAVVTKLMWVLGQTKKYDQVRWLFGSNLVGEVTLN
ncbi:MAG: asparaginase [Mogibacterium sp.]|nr:asparaginase [Mogibacterium sp.]